MRIILYVFSGTGNTLAVAELYKNSFVSQGAEVDIYRISKNSGEVPPPEDYDLIGLGYPIHAFCAPEPMIKFCKSLPAVQNKPAFFFKSSGEGLHVNDCSSQKCFRILKKKGYDFICEHHVVMPYNMIYRHTDGMAKHMWIYAHALAELNCREILSGERKKVKRTIFKRMWVQPIGFIERHFAHVHGRAFKVNKKKCVNCGLCAKNCPEGNITLKNGRYKFGNKCVLCMSCSFNCPKDAVKVGVFRFWKVNGSYRLDKLKENNSLPFPYIPDHAKGIYRLYKKYYRECDKRLKAAGMDINDYV